MFCYRACGFCYELFLAHFRWFRFLFAVSPLICGLWYFSWVILGFLVNAFSLAEFCFYMLLFSSLLSNVTPTRCHIGLKLNFNGKCVTWYKTCQHAMQDSRTEFSQTRIRPSLVHDCVNQTMFYRLSKWIKHCSSNSGTKEMFYIVWHKSNFINTSSNIVKVAKRVKHVLSNSIG